MNLNDTPRVFVGRHDMFSHWSAPWSTKSHLAASSTPGIIIPGGATGINWEPIPTTINKSDLSHYTYSIMLTPSQSVDSWTILADRILGQVSRHKIVQTGTLSFTTLWAIPCCMHQFIKSQKKNHVFTIMLPIKSAIGS